MGTVVFDDGTELRDSFSLSLGSVENAEVIHKFGENLAVGTAYVPVCFGGLYRTPQPAAATALRIKAGDADDTAAGSGARKVKLYGLDSTGYAVTEEISTNGTSAGTASTQTFIRLYRAYVTESGTYGSQSAGSHAADIVIENAAGTEDWATIDATNFPKGQTEIAVYSVPAGKVGYVCGFSCTSDSTKVTDMLLFRRGSILDVSPPYEAMRVAYQAQSAGDPVVTRPVTPIGPFPGPCDVGWLAKVSATTAAVQIDFEILVMDA